MKVFKLKSIDNSPMEIGLENPRKEVVFCVDINYLRKNNKNLIENKTAKVKFTAQTGKVVLAVKKEDGSGREHWIDITTNKDIVDYIYFGSGVGSDMSEQLYYYTTEGINNFCD